MQFYSDDFNRNFYTEWWNVPNGSIYSNNCCDTLIQLTNILVPTMGVRNLHICATYNASLFLLLWLGTRRIKSWRDVMFIQTRPPAALFAWEFRFIIRTVATASSSNLKESLSQSKYTFSNVVRDICMKVSLRRNREFIIFIYSNTRI